MSFSSIKTENCETKSESYGVGVFDFDRTIYPGLSFMDVFKEKALHSGRLKTFYWGALYCVKTSLLWTAGLYGRAISAIEELHSKLGTTDEELDTIYDKLARKIDPKNVELVKGFGCGKNYVLTRSRKRDVEGILKAASLDSCFDGVLGNCSPPGEVPYQTARDKKRQVELLANGSADETILFLTDNAAEAKAVGNLSYVRVFRTSRLRGR